jgi:hypothetical protein
MPHGSRPLMANGAQTITQSPRGATTREIESLRTASATQTLVAEWRQPGETTESASRRSRTPQTRRLPSEFSPSDNGALHKSLGFSVDATDLLIAALREIAQTGEVVESVETSHGEKYVVDGSLSSHTEGSHSQIARTVWIIDWGLEAPRLVTAYLGKE